VSKAWVIVPESGLGTARQSDYRFFAQFAATLRGEASMAVVDRIRSLRDKHAGLDRAIVKETTRALPDEGKLTEWKREKLRIKDTIEELSRQPQA
jgi:hypothetical protein